MQRKKQNAICVHRLSFRFKEFKNQQNKINEKDKVPAC